MTNQLSTSLSPYLLEHSRNPVDWYPWGPAAIELSQRLDRPIFLSIGYSACHWCHVMARESFESKIIAELLNQHFVNIKVDREERPDVDAIYMLALQMMSGSGGWPTSIFLTPELHPFYAGTYFPPHRRGTSPGFDEILVAVADAWENRRGEAVRYAREITEALRQFSSGPSLPSIVSVAERARNFSSSNVQDIPLPAGGDVPEPDLIRIAAERLQDEVDTRWGGFGRAPKFPEASSLELLLRFGHRTGDQRHLEAVRLTLLAMSRGGVYDILEGGFARYSVDDRWIVPHFEKMLYDNALLSKLYLESYQAFGDEVFSEVARQTLHYMVDTLSDPCGGLCSSEDADSLNSDGVMEEGTYYIWSRDEILSVLGEEDGLPFIDFYDVTERGNFSGYNLLHAAKGLPSVAERHRVEINELREMLSKCRAKLLARRRSRERPRRDEKVLTSWNAMAVKAFALGGVVLNESKFTATADHLGNFLWEQMRRDGVGLLHSWFQGTAHLEAYCDDYACLVDAFVTLYETSGRARWIGRACRLAEEMLDKFEDKEGGGLFFASPRDEALIARTKQWHDASTPASNGVAALALTRLGRVALRDDFLQAASRILNTAESVIVRQGRACSELLSALDFWHYGGKQWVFAASAAESLMPYSEKFFSRYRPNVNVAWVIGNAPTAGPMADLLRAKTPIDGGVTFYECEGKTCAAAITDGQSLHWRLEQTE